MAKSRQRSTTPDALIGKTLAGRYLVKSLIDRGGMGKVYEAEQQPLGRLVALKTLDLLDPRGEFKERFFNEASIASKLTHPNTVRIFDYGRSDDGTYFITMELLKGQSLQSLVKREAPLDAHRLIHVMRQVCSALQEAHEKGIVHRDMKPGNIFLTPHGDDFEFAKVLDFGLVKNLESDTNLSQTGQALGSPLYMSPEQVEGDRVDRRADIYSLGLVMYVALSGMVPFKKGSVATIMMQQVTAVVPSFAEIAPDVPIHPSIEWIVRRCIEKDRNERFASTRELSLALKLVEREMRGEVPGPIPWALTPNGRLDLPEELLGAAEESAGNSRAPLIEINDVPSSPTLNRSSTSMVAVGGAAITGVLFSILAVIGTLAVGLGVFFFWWSSQAPIDQPPPKKRIEIGPIGPKSAVEEPKPPAPIVQLLTDPAGAEVLRDGILVGTTPLPLTIAGDPLRFTVQLEGYESREVLVDGTVAQMPVKLKKTTTRSPKRPSQPAPPTPKDGIRDPWGAE